MKQDKSYILKLYKQYEKEKPNTDKFNELLRKFNLRRNALDKTLKHKQRKELQKLIEIMYDMRDEENKQYFEEGFSIPIRIFGEVLDENM
mgnify:CR=1 FL=1